MSHHPKITLITTVRNGAAFIERCLQSVVSQNYPNLEYMVLDAASTDGTQAIIERYKPYITFFRSAPDKGPNDAIMQAYTMATGELVGLVHADDWLSSGALHTLAAMYQVQPDADMFCFGMQEYKQGQGATLQKTKTFIDPAGEVFTLLDGLYCQGVNRYYSKRLLTKEGVYRDEVYPNLADRDFYIRLGLLHVKKAWTDKILYNFLTHPGSNSTGGSAQKTIRFLDETARMAQDYLKHSAVNKADKNLLHDWYCFNMIRSIAFRVKAGRLDAVLAALTLWLRYPIRSIRNAINYKMPQPYRARPPV